MPHRHAICAREQSPACAACAAGARLQPNGCLHGLLHAAMHRCTGDLPLQRLQDGCREPTQAALGLCNRCRLDVNLFLCHRVRGNSAGLLKNVGDGWVLLHGARIQQNGAASSTLQTGLMHASSALGLTLRVLRSRWRPILLTSTPPNRIAGSIPPATPRPEPGMLLRTERQLMLR